MKVGDKVYFRWNGQLYIGRVKRAYISALGLPAVWVHTTPCNFR